MDHHSFTEQYLAIIRDTLRVQTTDDGKKGTSGLKTPLTNSHAGWRTILIRLQKLQSPQPVRTLLSRCTRFITGIHRT
jgi:hypothetical protein